MGDTEKLNYTEIMNFLFLLTSVSATLTLKAHTLAK